MWQSGVILCGWMLMWLSGTHGDGSVQVCCPAGKLDYTEHWGYVPVRPNANMFWWLYSVNQTDSERPLFLWLQGGPGSSSTGFGNFQELGPKDNNNNDNPATWLQRGDLLFVDNPVGTGFSYVTDKKAFTTDVDQIADDLLTLAKAFFKANPHYETTPFYIFCESYGGKMSAAFALVLKKAILAGEIQCNLKGVNLGDSWISPIDYVLSWGSYLFYQSYLDEQQYVQVMNKAQQCRDLVDHSRFLEATGCWEEIQSLIGEFTNGVSWYNILKRDGSDPWSKLNSLTPIQRLHRKLRITFEDPLVAFMNGEIKEKLKIIPANVTWGGQGGDVFAYQAGDFMKPVINTVDQLLNYEDLKVVVFNGQLDLICDTFGTEQWIQKLKWSSLSDYNKAEKSAFSLDSSDQTAGFYKGFKNFKFFWILRAGHMVAHDAAQESLKMIDLIMS